MDWWSAGIMETYTHEAGLTLEIRLALVCKTPQVHPPGVVRTYERVFAIRLLPTRVLVSDERRGLPLVENRLGMARMEHKDLVPNDGPSNGQDERHRDG